MLTPREMGMTLTCNVAGRLFHGYRPCVRAGEWLALCQQAMPARTKNGSGDKQKIQERADVASCGRSCKWSYGGGAR